MTDQTTAGTSVPDETRIFLTHEVQRAFQGRARVDALRKFVEMSVREEEKGVELWFKGVHAFGRSLGLTSSISKKGTLDITVGFVPDSLRPRVISVSEHRANDKTAADRLFAEKTADAVAR